MQYIDTFQAASVGAGLPAGWSPKWNTPTWSVIDESGDKLVHMNAASPASRWAAIYDAGDSDAARADIDIIVKFRASAIATASLAGIVVRASGTSSADSAGYACVMYGPDRLRINKYVGGVTTAINTTDSGPAFASGGWYFMRFRVNGTTLQAKIWSGVVGDQPAEWLIEITDASVTAAGSFGFFATGAAVTYDFAEIAMATGGDVPTFAVDTTAPVLTSPTGTTLSATTASGSVTTDEGNGTLYFLASTNATETAATVKAGGPRSGTLAISSTGVKNINVTGLTAATLYYLHYVHRDAAGNDSARVSSSSFTTSSADVTAPTLSAASGTQTGATTATLSVSTNENNGVLYAVVTTSATPPTTAQIRAGQNNAGTAAAWASNPSNNQTINSTGTKTFGATGLLPSTTYYTYFHHRDASGNDSTVAAASSFTTAASGTKGIRVPLYSNALAQASLTGLSALWWDATTPHTFGAPQLATNSASTDASGLLTLNLSSSTALAIGAQGFLLVFKLDGGDAKDSLLFGGLVTVEDIA